MIFTSRFSLVPEILIKIITKLLIKESFNRNILHQLFDYKITFVNSKREDTNSKGDFVVKKRFYKNKFDSDLL